MVEYKNGYYFLRLDNIETVGLYGEKSRLAYNMCKNQKGVVTCGSRESIQTVAFAEMCDKLNIPCEIHIPKGKDTDGILRLKKTNCVLHRENVGYNNVINARARNNAEEKKYKFVQLGMLCDEAYDLIKGNVEYIKPYLPKINKIVVPVGSGTTIIGLLKGLNEFGYNIKVAGVMIGMDATKNILKNVKYDNLELTKSKFEYKDKGQGDFAGITLNLTYESKCIEFLEKNDLLYIVSK